MSQRVRSSVARMGVPSIDLLQLHWEPPTPPPSAAAGSKGSSSKGQPPPGFVAAAKVLKQLQQEGLVKQLGVSNFDVPMLLALLDAGVKPVSNQVWNLVAQPGVHTVWLDGHAAGLLTVCMLRLGDNKG